MNPQANHINVFLVLLFPEKPSNADEQEKSMRYQRLYQAVDPHFVPSHNPGTPNNIPIPMPGGRIPFPIPEFTPVPIPIP